MHKVIPQRRIEYGFLNHMHMAWNNNHLYYYVLRVYLFIIQHYQFKQYSFIKYIPTGCKKTAQIMSDSFKVVCKRTESMSKSVSCSGIQNLYIRISTLTNTFLPNLKLVIRIVLFWS